jgi:serine/threonine protein kinase
MFEYFKDENRYCIITEILSGGELFEKIKKNPNGHFPESKARVYMRQILQAVNYMHKKGYVHRDVKPENLLIDGSDGSLKLIDFGLSIALKPG